MVVRVAIAVVSSIPSPTPSPSGRIRCNYNYNYGGSASSVRSIPIRITSVGKKRSAGVQLIVDDYLGKISLYCSVQDLLLRPNPKNARDIRAQINDEDASVVRLIKPDDLVVMLDERGLDISSEEMADLIADAGISGASRLSFCIGGPYGHGQKLRARADKSIKLSSLVLNHQIALVVLMEQLYSLLFRSWTILKGQNYHH